MTLTEVTETFYAILLYKKEGYDCFKYNFKLPQSYNKPLERFYEKNKFNLQELAIYEKSAIILRILITIFIYNKNAVINVSNHDYESFKNSLFEYQNEISLFLNNYKVSTPMEVYQLFLKRKIPFYVFYYTIRYVRFEEQFTKFELLTNKFKEIHSLMRFFKHFDTEIIQKMLHELQKEIDLTRS